MEKHTERQQRVWLAWLLKQWNEPDRADYYVMALVAELLKTPARVWGKTPSKVDLNDLKISFTSKAISKQVPSLTMEQASSIAKARWFGATGYSGEAS